MKGTHREQITGNMEFNWDEVKTGRAGMSGSFYIAASWNAHTHAQGESLFLISHPHSCLLLIDKACSIDFDWDEVKTGKGCMSQ